MARQRVGLDGLARWPAQPRAELDSLCVGLDGLARWPAQPRAELDSLCVGPDGLTRWPAQPRAERDSRWAVLREMVSSLEPSQAGHRAVVGCMACGAVVRSRAHLSVGGFSAAMGVGGEEEMLVWDLWAAGWGAVYADDVVAHHPPSVSRDPSARRTTLVRNDLWTAWARLPAGAACERTLSLLLRGHDHPMATARGAVRAVRRADWALARRSPLRAFVERARQRITT